MLRALSHPDRRAFVAACTAEAKAAGELAALSELSLATVSEHLKVLRKSGLLVLEKRGRFWFYRTNAEVVARAVKEVAELTQTAPSHPFP